MKIKNILYYIAYILEIIYTIGSDIPFVSKISRYLNIIIFMILVFVFFIQSKKYSIKKFLFIIISFTFFMISSYVSKNTSFVILMLFIISSKDIDLDKIIKYDLMTKIVLSLLIITLWKFGFLSERIMLRDGLTRHSLGFSHPNLFGLCLFSIVCDYFFLKYKKLNIFSIIVFLIIYCICTFICGSRSAQIGMISIILFSLLLPKFENKDKHNKMLIYFPIILILTSYIITILYPYNFDFINKLNEAFSSRIKLSYSFLSYYGINLWGHYFEYYNIRYTYSYFYALDNAYMYMLIRYGLILCSLIIYLFIKIIKYAIREKKYQILVYLLPFLIYGLMEKYLIIFQYNVILLYGTSLILLNNNKKNKVNDGGKNEK